MRQKHTFTIIALEYVHILQLPRLLKTVLDYQVNNDMPCFDPEDVIFILNKWDTIRDRRGKEIEKEKREKVWNKLKGILKENWPFQKEENIFRLNLEEVLE